MNNNLHPYLPDFIGHQMLNVQAIFDEQLIRKILVSWTASQVAKGVIHEY